MNYSAVAPAGLEPAHSSEPEILKECLRRSARRGRQFADLSGVLSPPKTDVTQSVTQSNWARGESFRRGRVFLESYRNGHACRGSRRRITVSFAGVA